MRPVDLVLERLGNHEQRNGYFMVPCPAHEDPEPSLSIKEGDDGRALLHCFAGCSPPEIVAAMDLEMSDLFPPSANGRRGGRRKNSRGKPTATWGIRDADGELQAKHVRFEREGGGKDCLWRLPGASEWGLKGRKLSTLPLYRSELVKEWPEDVPVVVTEGEKAADALAAVYPAVLGTVTGAEGTPSPEVLEVLRGRRVVLWPDNDKPGRAHMRRIARALAEARIVSEVRIFEWTDAPEKGDAADHPAVKDRGREDLERLRAKIAIAPTWEPELSSSSSSAYRGNDDDDDEGGRGRLEVKRFSGLPKPDGPRQFRVGGLVPERFVTTIYGEGGSSKSVLALSIALGCARGDKSWLGFELEPGAALYVDWELDEEEQGRRARQLARADGDGEPPENLYYLSAVGHRTGEVVSASLAACEAHGIGLVVLDSAGMAMEGDPLAGHDAIRFFRELDRFRAQGVTVLLIDHQGKTVVGESYQAKTAYGSVYKGNLSRSRIQVEARERGEGTLGVTLRHNKSNFSGLSDPFKVRITFTEEAIKLGREDLEDDELVEERTLNGPDRVLLALQAGPAFPDELAERTGMTTGTVKNCLTGLKKRGEVEYTGEMKGRAQQVQLSSSSSLPLDSDDDDDGEKPVERERFTV